VIAVAPDRARDTIAGDPLGGCCFRCTKPILDYPVVIWRGSSGALILHIGCAEELGISLLADAWAAKATT
jgi:hypothetical protein